ncbi:MAG: iron donor protein CyaY [Burkholderiales bacterium]
MNESEFASACAAVLDTIEAVIDNSESDIDCQRKSDGVLEIEFENGSRVVVNGQTPMRQIWVAAKSGGYHLNFQAGVWRDTRSGEDLAALMTRVAREQGAADLRFVFV